MAVIEPRIQYYEIACQQVLEEDYSVFSIQWMVIPEAYGVDMTPGELMRLYFAYIRFFTYPLVAPVNTGDGIEFRLLCTNICLLKFSRPEHQDILSGKKATLYIEGGVLVQPGRCDQGALDFLVERIEEGIKLTLQLTDYCPLLLGSQQPSRWRKLFYRLTQAYIHKVVTVRFLSRVYRKLVGRKAQTKVVKVAIRAGAET